LNNYQTQQNQQHSQPVEDQLALAKAAACGEKSAREKVNALTHPLIEYQTARFCKRFCSENQYLYRCTLKPPMGSPRLDVAWCEWGNASYGWMLNDLSHEKRLLKYQGKNGARLFDYFYQIANSLPFYERWKDWRFGRKVHVPTYIKALAPDAPKVFLALRSGESIEIIAQKLSRRLADIETLVHSIICLLTEKKRLHLLDPPRLISISETVDDKQPQLIDREPELASYDEAIDQQEDKQRLHQAWSKLSAVEQFVLEALLIEDQDADDVLAALKQMQLSIKSGVSAEQTNRQQLYYFRRKTLEKLTTYMKE